MKCGFCGIEVTPPELQSLSEKAELCISQFVYDQCSHESPKDDLNENSALANLEQKKMLVDNQIKSIEKLEGYLLSRKEALMTQLKEFCEANKSFLMECEKVSREFDTNFQSLTKITVDPACKEKFRDNLQEYFDHDVLVTWAQNCQRDSGRLLKKINFLEEELNRDLEQITFKQVSEIHQLAQPLRSKLNLHDITFKAIEKDKEKLKASMAETEHAEALKTLRDIYDHLHVQAQDIIKIIVGEVFKIAKKNDAIVTRNKYLLSSNVTEIKNNTKILAIFEGFDEVFGKCIEELKQRGKFRFIYKRVLQMLNDLTKIENGRRANFMHKYSSKIPSQIFPNIKKLSKEINIEKFFEGLDEELPIENHLCQKLEESLQSIQHTLFAL